MTYAVYPVNELGEIAVTGANGDPMLGAGHRMVAGAADPKRTDFH